MFRFFKWGRKPNTPPADDLTSPAPIMDPPASSVTDLSPHTELVRRHFYNERGFQCYASFFPHWKGWVTAGHVLTDAGHAWPDFTGSPTQSHIWPEGLDAALHGCRLPKTAPAPPYVGQKVIARGFPAGARQIEERRGTVYIERNAGSGVWIAHIISPDEPVVSGMSGGPVLDAKTGIPIGILITRNSPADLNADRDPDESCDFVSLRAVWEAVKTQQRMS